MTSEGFEVGVKIRLRDSELNKQKSITARPGAIAVVVPWSTFPEWAKEMEEILPPEDRHYFVAVRWVDEPSYSQSNGFYLAERFEGVQ